jgi:hypothetical protein
MGSPDITFQFKKNSVDKRLQLDLAAAGGLGIPSPSSDISLPGHEVSRRTIACVHEPGFWRLN